MVPSKEVEVEYPGFPGFTMKLAFLSRETLIAVRKKATKTTIKHRVPVEELDDDLFLKLYVNSTIKGWSGLTLEYLNKLAPVDITGKDEKTLLPYSEENALALMKSSTDLDSFVSDKVNDLANFSTSSSKI